MQINEYTEFNKTMKYDVRNMKYKYYTQTSIDIIHTN